jgi:outer membrane receptor for ferrienterochelin and colicin
MAENRRGGQSDYDFESDNGMSDYYGIKIDTRKFYGYGKIGMLFPGKPYNSIGFMTSATVFSLDGLIGPNKYSGEQMSYYSNLIYQSIILSTNHTYNIGFSFLYDRYDEILNDRVFEQTEIIPGIFGQYTYTKPDKFNGILGLRADRNSRYGLLVTPRGHIRYDLGAHTTFRASAGKGYRSAHALAENMGIIASSRTFYFNEEFEIESAWNYGMNLNRNFHMGNNKEINVSLDLYRTDFQNQIIVDMDRDISGVYFYNLKGRSYSNSFQAQVSITPVEHFDITAAFRFNDVKSTINGTLQEVPLTARYKGLLTLSYATWYNKWSFDLTTQLNGQNRLPDTRMNPSEYQKDEYSPEYVIIHAQVTKRFKYFDIYIGGENLTDFMQEDPVIAPDDPFGEYFDASMVWGPLMGRTFYAGIRYTLKNKS